MPRALPLIVVCSRRIVAACSLALLTACSHPPTRTVTLPSGRTVEMFAVGPMVGPRGMMDRALAHDTVLMVRYVGASATAERIAQREEVLAWASPMAERARIRYVGLEHKEYPYGRLLPFVRGGISFYDRDTSGAWVRHDSAPRARP